MGWDIIFTFKEKKIMGIFEKFTLGAVAATAVLLSGMASAGEITIWDGEGVGAVGNPMEDGETEPGTINNQSWDLEGMYIDEVDGNDLKMVGGFNFVLGEGGFESGDIFIALGGEPVYGSGSTPSGDGTHMLDYGYDYVIDVNWDNPNNLTYEVYAANQTVGLVYYSQNDEANPFQVTGVDVGQSIYSGTFTQTEEDGAYLGLGGTQSGADHYEVGFDLAWLDAVNTGDEDAWFHFTMRCGNDNLMGFAEGGTIVGDQPVPEPGTLLLLGMGLSGVAFSRVRKKRF